MYLCIKYVSSTIYQVCIHKLNTTFIFNYVANQNESATNISILVLRELINVRSRQLVFSSEHFSFRDVADMINCIARSPYILRICLIAFVSSSATTYEAAYINTPMRHVSLQAYLKYSYSAISYMLTFRLKVITRRSKQSKDYQD